MEGYSGGVHVESPIRLQTEFATQKKLEPDPDSSPTSSDDGTGEAVPSTSMSSAPPVQAASSSGDPAAGLVHISVSTAGSKANKRRQIKTNFEKIKLSEDTEEKQRREAERLQRQQDRLGTVPTAESYSAVRVVPDEYGFFDEPHFQHQHLPSTAQDDIVFDKMVEAPTSKRLRADQSDDIECIELSSDDDDDDPVAIYQNSFSGYPRVPPYQPTGWSPFDPHPKVRLNQEAQIKREHERRHRKRRKSGDYESTELTQGRLLVNKGRPEEDPDVFVATHLTDILQPHQLGGVRFMYDNIIETLKDFKDSPGLGCILAHSMGLGKTIQVITFVDIFFRATGSKKVLIVCPVNVIQNWFNEFNKWMPETEPSLRQFNLFLMGDSVKGLESRAQLIDDWHTRGGVLLMGYEMFRLLVKDKQQKQKKITVKELREMRKQLAADALLSTEAKNAREEELRSKLKTALVDPGPDLVVCDEGHRIKNLKTDVAETLNSIRTRRRIVLTGYPLQNNLMEYFCMVDFVRPSYLGTKKNFGAMFDRPIKNGQCIDSTPRDVKIAKQRTHVLIQMLRGFVQRRSQHILKKILPESKEYVVLLRKSRVQHELYRSFVLYAAEEIRSQNSNFYNPLKAFAICSKIWNHPDLLYSAFMKKKNEQKPEQTELSFGIPLDFKPSLPEGSATNGFTESFMRAPDGYDGSANANMAGIQNFIGGMAPFNCNAMPSPAATLYGAANAAAGWMQQPTAHAGYANSSFPSMDPNMHGQPYGAQTTHSQQNSFWPPNGTTCPPSTSAAAQCQQSSGWDSIAPALVPEQQWSSGSSSSCPQSSTPSSEWTSASMQFPSVDEPEKKPKTSRKTKPNLTAALYGDEIPDDNTIRFDWAEDIMERFAVGCIDNSYKMRIAMSIIDETTRRGEKILFFSGSILTLDLFENYLTSKARLQLRDSTEEWKRNVTYCRFDGSTSGVDREKLINRFNEDPGLYLFLISTRAGSLGVNLVSANRVIIFDASWNPCHDAQAVCRIYRYGQQKKTFIYRLIMSNSMEKAIFNRQISKHGLQQRVVDEQNIDANVTTNEIENLIAYDENLDVVTGEWDVDEWEVEDDLLLDVARQHSGLFAEAKGLSAEEKMEAQLLYDREKNGHHVGDNLLNDESVTGLEDILRSVPRRPAIPGYLPTAGYPSENLFNGSPYGMAQRVHHPSPFPKELARFQAPPMFAPMPGNPYYGASAMAPILNRPPLQQPSVSSASNFRPSGSRTIQQDITLLSLNRNPVSLRKGDVVTVIHSSNGGVYLRTQQGLLLDARGTIYEKSDDVIELD